MRSRLLCIVATLVFVVSMVPVATAQYTWAGLPVVSHSFANPPGCYIYFGVHYAQTTVKYTVLPPPPETGLQYGVAVEAIERGFDEWNNAGSNLKFVRVDKGGLPVTWGVLPAPYIRNSAVTYRWRNDKLEVTRALIMFNINYRWFAGSPMARAWDLQGIAAHEAGHLVGLGDLSLYVNPAVSCRADIMSYANWKFQGDTTARRLGPGDTFGIRMIYGISPELTELIGAAAMPSAGMVAALPISPSSPSYAAKLR